MQIINTRPTIRAQLLTTQLREAGYEVFELPLLVLEPLIVDQQLKLQYQAFQQAECVVVVSPTAAELGLKHYFNLGYSKAALRDKQWIAVGKATQHYLEKFDIPSIAPDVETSEGMLSLPIFNNRHQRTVAFWRGIGGREFMMNQLVEQGCKIINMLLYTRHLPEQSLIDACEIKEMATVLMSSEESWHNWCKLAEKYPWRLSQYHYIVLGDRVSQILQDYFLHKNLQGKISTVYTLNAENIISQLKKNEKMQHSEPKQ